MPIPHKEEQMAYYENLLQKYGEGPHVLDWNNQKSQEDRFRVLLQVIYYGGLVKTPTILDVGCGLGDLRGYLSDAKDLFPDGFHYTGYDISPRLIQRARQRYPAGHFEVVDILERSPGGQFDFVLCSGTLNICVSEREEHDRYAEQMLRKMFGMAKQAVSVNFLSQWYLDSFQNIAWQGSRYAHFSPETILSWCRQLTPRVILRHDYLPSDFTVYLLR